jgi:hypothetical protein
VQAGSVGGGEGDGEGLGVPAGLAGKDRDVACGLSRSESVAADLGGDASPVGGHPAELPVIEFDQYTGGEKVDLREQWEKGQIRPR